MNFTDVFKYYSREDVQNALVESARDREVVGVFRNGGFGSRPNTLMYPQDIIAMVKTGVIEFHNSIEHWSQPMALKSENYESLRKGWDLILDLDCELFEHGKVATVVLIWALGKHDIKNFSVKFTGGTGFHIGIPWRSIPEKIDYKPSVKQFPELARKMGLYLKDFIKERLEKELLKNWSPEDLSKQTGKPLGKILTAEGIDPFQIVDVDPVLISSRHLFRMPYSLHRKNFLVSLPVDPKKIHIFEKEYANPRNVKVKTGFLDKGEPNEAELLIAETIDWWSRTQIKKEIKERSSITFHKAVQPELFPPCINIISKGLSDGRKRSVFVLTNFLSSMKWKWSDIEAYLMKWNQKNKPPLRDNYIRTHLRWHKNRRKTILPPGCKKEGYYKAFGVCQPDNFCGGQAKTINNPAVYPWKKMGNGKNKEKKTQKKKYKPKPKK